MAVTLLASQVPAPVVPGTPNYMADQNSTTGTPSTSLALTSGNLGAQVSGKLNRNHAGYDQQSVYGGGGYGIGSGLVLSAGAGLTVAVADGQALVNGMVELRNTSSTTAVVGATGTAWVWLMQNGTLTVQNGTTAKPSGNCCLLGAALTNATAVTAVETAGVVYFKNGLPWRETADAGAPGDSPDSSLRLFTKTAGGTYFWDGTAHRLVAGSTTRAGTNASRSGVVDGDLYLSTDGPYIERYNGSSWTQKHSFALVKPDAFTAWTTRGGTGTTAEVGGALCLTATAAAANAIVAYCKAIPTATPYTVDFMVEPLLFNVATPRVGVVFRDSGGKFYLFGLERPGGLTVQRYNAYNTSTSTLKFESFNEWHPIGLRLTDNGTTLGFAISADGANYHTFVTEARASFLTPAEYGFGVDSANASYPALITVLSVKVS